MSSETVGNLSLLKVFLFTDLVGSVELKRRLGDAIAARLIAAHDDLFRRCLAESGGSENDNAGDGFSAVFDRPSDALRCALEFQRGLSELGGEEPLRVRIGLHLGETSALDQGSEHGKTKYVGLAIDTAARVMSLAQGGQILLTRAAFDSARQHIQSASDGKPVVWLAHGPYRFKGIDDPLEIFEAGVEGLSPLAPPPDSEKARRAIAPGDEETLGWRPAVDLEVPGRPGWKLERKLGEGGFGEVWVATNTRTHEQRTFKFCFKAERLRTLKRELTLFRLLKETLGERPDIARLYDVQLETAPYYLEMDYTAGGDLAAWADRQGGIDKVPLETRLEIIAQVAEALAAAHSVGVIHKDVKPTNVLIEEKKDGTIQAKLTDFGIGQLVSREALQEAGITAEGFSTRGSTVLTELGSRTGTRLYMAPELLAGKPPTIQSDIYALGVMLYQVVVTDLQRPLGQGWEPGVDDDLLRQDIDGCIQGQATLRLQSCEMLAHNLRSLNSRRATVAERIERELKEARHVEALELSARRAKRRRTVFAWGAAASLVLAALLGYQLWDHDRLLSQSLANLDRANYNQAITDIHYAWTCITDGRLGVAEEALTQIPEERRNWEWYYLWDLVHPPWERLRLENTKAFILSPLGNLIAVNRGEPSRRTEVWDLESTRRIFESPNGNYEPIFSPDGSTLLLYDSTSLSNLIWGGHSEASSQAQGTGNQQIATGWDMGEGKRKYDLVFRAQNSGQDQEFRPELSRMLSRTIPYYGGSRLKFRLGGELIGLSDKSHDFILWDASDGNLVASIFDCPDRNSSEQDFVAREDFLSPNGELCVHVSNQKAIIHRHLSRKSVLELSGNFRTAMFTPDGSLFFLADAGANLIRVWRTDTWNQIGQLAFDLSNSLSFPLLCDDASTRLLTLGRSKLVAYWWDDEGENWRISQASVSPTPSVFFYQRLRSFEPHVPQDVTHEELEQIRSQHPEVTSGVSASNGSAFLLTLHDGSRRIWDPTEKSLLIQFDPGDREINDFSLVGEAGRLAAIFADGEIALWDIAEDREVPLRVAETDANAFSRVVFGPKGKYLLAYEKTTSPDSRRISIIRTEDGIRLARLYERNMHRLSMDGKFLFTFDENPPRPNSERSLLVLKSDVGTSVTVPQAGATQAFASGLFYSPETALAIFSSGSRIHAFDCEEGIPKWETEASNQILSGDFIDRSGKQIALVTSDEIEIRDATSGEIQKRLPLPNGSDSFIVTRAEIPSGIMLFTTSNSDRGQIWSLPDLQTIGEVEVKNLRQSEIEFTDDGNYVLITENGVVNPRDLIEGKREFASVTVRSVSDTVSVRANLDVSRASVVEFNTSRKELYIGSIEGKLDLWRLEADSLIDAGSTLLGGRVTGLAAGAAGFLVTETENKDVKIWDLSHREKLRSRDHELAERDVYPVHGLNRADRLVGLSADGPLGAGPRSDLNVQVVDLTTGELIKNHILPAPREQRSYGLNVSDVLEDQGYCETWKWSNAGVFDLQNAHRLYGSAGRDLFAVVQSPSNVLRVFTMESGEELGTYEPKRPITSLRLHADPPSAVFTQNDSNVFYWDLARGGAPKAMKGHTLQPICVDISSDGSLAATGGNDSQVILWDIQSRVKIGQTTIDGDIVSYVGFCADDHSILVARQDMQVSLLSADANLKEKKLASKVKSLALSPERNHAAFLTGGELELWDLSNVSRIARETCTGSELRFARSGEVVFVRENGLQPWQKWRVNLVKGVIAPTSETIEGNAYNPAADRYITIHQGIAEVRETRGGSVVVSLRAEEGGIDWAQLTPDGKTIVARKTSGGLAVFDTHGNGQLARMK